MAAITAIYHIYCRLKLVHSIDITKTDRFATNKKIY